MSKLNNDIPGELVVASILEQHQLRPLLANIRKSIELWFLVYREAIRKNDLTAAKTATSQESQFYNVQMNTALILQHGLRPLTSLEIRGNQLSLQKLMDDIESVRRAAQLRHSSNIATCNNNNIQTDHLAALSDARAVLMATNQFLMSWILRCLNENCLSICLQELVADKELLNTYYYPWSFLHNDIYATALFICLSSLELKQYSLLSQVEPSLYRFTLLPPVAIHKRSSSHPNISISPSKKTTATVSTAPANGTDHESQQSSLVYEKPKRKHVTPTTVFYTFRKVRSLPSLIPIARDVVDTKDSSRPRSKTLSTLTVPSKSKQIRNAQVRSDLTIAIASTTHFDDCQPSTSASSSHMSVMKPSVNIRPQIQLIKCDDIKIWTDQSEIQCQHSEESSVKETESLTIPQNQKKVSPINSFLSSLFTTSPRKTSWSLGQRSCSLHSRYLCNSNNEIGDSSCSSVFDSFLPKYGKKLRPCKAHSLFEDGISSLNSTFYDHVPSTPCTTIKGDTGEENCKVECQGPPKDCQSLTLFLQTAQLSRNNTDLEKENAHFRVSEAIISAIEHIKSTKHESVQLRRTNEKPAEGTDYLRDEHRNGSYVRDQAKNAPPRTIETNNEHISYAELGESSLDLLSAEVVGLCLLSKFNDRALPKVSELKWLVGEDETRQELLPMPDCSSSLNPDNNISPSVTRGTKYWAPPRPQIIFTDHPPPNRKELIQKQNHRCAGCGMRVSPQYVSSFRFCTYFGKYHCTGCHRNQISPTPAKILNMWDFKCYPVSVIAYHLLEQIYMYPLFYVTALNPSLYKRSKPLLAARTKRIHLRYVRDFIKSCRYAAVEQQYFEEIPNYIHTDPDTWSMSDFTDANNNCMQRCIDEFISKCELHIFGCVLCTARGFLCEHCRKAKVIFPWQSKVYRCDYCGSCFHLNCWKYALETCCRCQRIKTRQHDLIEDPLESS